MDPKRKLVPNPTGLNQQIATESSSTRPILRRQFCFRVASEGKLESEPEPRFREEKLVLKVTPQTRKKNLPSLRSAFQQNIETVAYQPLTGGKHEDGWMVNGGRCVGLGVAVGAAGCILGGGLSLFMRQFRMGCDNLQEATIVIADGKKFVVKETGSEVSPKGKLFWALCGAGHSNFGVVVGLKTKSRNSRGKEGNWSARWFKQKKIEASWLFNLNDVHPGKLRIRFTAYYDGNKADFDKEIEIEAKVKDKRLIEALKSQSRVEPSTEWLHRSLPKQFSEKTERLKPTSRKFALYSSFIFNNSLENVTAVTTISIEELETFKRIFNGEKASATASWIQTGGKAEDTGKSDTAYRWRSAEYVVYLYVAWESDCLERNIRKYCKSLKSRPRPFSLNKRATFTNFPDRTLRPEYHEQTYHEINRQKL
ncbi:hypothetical protein BKA65DRAFT_563226 [Rhexocercosporidium sp. MPI-PUGE-AT-0058]|nr:hypothetical protein BKA65DRAFT_563226 [Rhexocercosporidium sp. MPI-PUGE-AT-0058]